MNLISANKKFVKILFVLTAISFLWFGTFGLIHHMSEMKPVGVADSSGCLFDGQTEVCNMNFSEHIAIWQSMFTSLPQNTELLGMLILAVVLFLIIVFLQNHFEEFSRRISSRFKLYTKQHPRISLYKIKTTHWLSLFENSPSLMYARHN